jgi:hypothetical protein
MQLFAPDLYRNVVLGFMLGALAVVLATSDEWDAQAASMPDSVERVTPSPEFLIGAE